MVIKEKSREGIAPNELTLGQRIIRNPEAGEILDGLFSSIVEEPPEGSIVEHIVHSKEGKSAILNLREKGLPLSEDVEEAAREIAPYLIHWLLWKDDELGLEEEPLREAEDWEGLSVFEERPDVRAFEGLWSRFHDEVGLPEDWLVYVQERVQTKRDE